MLLIVSGHKIIISFVSWFHVVLNFGANYNKFPQIQISSQMIDKFQKFNTSKFSKYKHFIRVKKYFFQ